MSNKTSSNSSSGGIGFFGALAIAFIVLKLCDVINWSWIWVLSPIWLPISIIILIFLLWVFVYVCIKVKDSYK